MATNQNAPPMDFPEFAQKFKAYKKTHKGKRSPLVTVLHFPTAPGWWVQWCGRSDWQLVDAVTGQFLRDIISAAGDRVVCIGE